MTPPSYGAASREPVYSGNRRIPGLWKRTKETGTVVYEARQHLGGRLRRVSLKATTKTDAIAEQRRLAVDYERGEPSRSPAAALTLADLAADWLAHLETRTHHRDPRHRRSPRTIELNRQRLSRWILPDLGYLAPNDLTVAHLRRLIDKMVGKGLAPSTVTGTINIMSALLQWTVRNGHATRNIVRDLDRNDRPGSARLTEPRYLTDTEVQLLLDKMGDTFRPIAATLAYAGLRVSEALGLRWRDLDLKKDTLTVSGQLGPNGERVPVKTPASAATIPMLPALKRELTAHRARQVRRDLRGVNRDALVFTTTNGRPNTRRAALRAVNNAATAAGLNSDDREPVGPHDLRHSLVGIAFDHGATLPEVSQLARHANARVTAAVYAGITDDSRQKVTKKLLDAGYGAWNAFLIASDIRTGPSDASGDSARSSTKSGSVVADMATRTTQPQLSFAPDLLAAAAQTPGARFLKADLQVHTPLDPQFEPRQAGNSAADRADIAHKYLKAAQDRGIELVGITEHNDVSWIDELRHAAKGLGIYLLPGFEVESSEGIHVLCLFDPETKVVDLEDTLARLELTTEKRTRQKRLELRADRDFPKLVTFIQDDCGGVCIAAHMDSDKGLLSFGTGGARADRWKVGALLAGQISRPAEELHPGTRRIVDNDDPTYRRDRHLACLLTSDARSIADIGTKATWVKLDRVGVDGLRQAFLDPESRLSLADPATRRQGPRILAVAWEGGFLGGTAFPLSPELNTLIGGKGTGKSTVIESIRYAFGESPRTKQAIAAATALRDSALKSGSKVSVLVDTGPPGARRYVIERTSPHSPVVRDELGEALPDLQASQLVKADIYGQKEVFEVAQDTQARLALLDGFAIEELRDVLERERAIIQRADTNASLILDTRKRMDDAEVRLSELPNLEAWRTRFREAGFEDRLRERRLIDREERMLVSLDGSLLEAKRGLDQLGTHRPGSDVPVEEDDETLPDADLVERATKLVSGAETRWTATIDSLRVELETARTELAAVRAEWESRRAARAAEFDRALRELQERMPDVDPERYLDVERRIEQLTPLRAAVGQLSERLQEALSERTRLLIDLDDVRGAKHRIRNSAARRLTDATGGNVQVELAHRADRNEFIERLGALKTGARVESLRRMVEADDFSPASFAAHVRGHTLRGQWELPDGQATLLEREISESALLKLDTAELCDQVSIGLDVGLAGAREYRPLEKLSPGQKSTAILLLIMQASDVPLLIDQPEDDLDNRFIYDDVVKRLRAEKSRRQFLIATHNANIPVLGDAEQILVLDASDRGGALIARGAIDNSDVRDAAELILEGGEEAFTLRREKYGW